MSFLSWAERTANIPEETITGERTATPAELVLLAEEFGVLELSQLTCSYKIRPLAGNRFSVRGKILASITQNCVVTLDPVRLVDTPVLGILLVLMYSPSFRDYVE